MRQRHLGGVERPLVDHARKDLRGRLNGDVPEIDPLDLHRAIVDWSEWAAGVVEDWEDTRHPDWTGYADVFAQAVAFASPEERR